MPAHQRQVKRYASLGGVGSSATTTFCQSPSCSIVGAMLAVSTLAFWVLVFSYISFRSAKARTAFEGLPVVVVRDGLPVDEHLDLERITVDEVAGEARSQGIADLRDVRIAILEPGGQFSFVLRDGATDQQQRGGGPPAL